MVYQCLGICRRELKHVVRNCANHLDIKFKERYYCRQCIYFLSVDNKQFLINGNRCPCCHSLMIKKPRSRELRERFQKRLDAQKQLDEISSTILILAQKHSKFLEELKK